MGPIEMFFSVQSLLCAISVVGVMKLVTAILTLSMGKDSRGKPRYKSNKVLTVIVLPAATVLLGVFYGALVPFRPAPLAAFASANAELGLWVYLAYAAWGGACGQFAQTLYDRASDLVGMRKRAPRDDSPDPTK